jgi:hypothetical protein
MPMEYPEKFLHAPGDEETVQPADQQRVSQAPEKDKIELASSKEMVMDLANQQAGPGDVNEDFPAEAV